MNFLEPALLGIIQGFAEWLPISSEGVSSLVMMNFFGKSLSEAVYLSLWLHTGTLLAALVYFRKEVLGIVKNLPSYARNSKDKAGYNSLTTFLVISTLITGLIGGPLLLLSLNNIDFSLNAAMALIGILLVATGLLQIDKKTKGFRKEIKIRDSITLGIVQAFSVLPGLSRSGLTTSALLFRKYEGKEALRLSFLMSIPVVLGAEIGLGLLGKVTLDLYSAVAILFAFASGLATIKILMKVAERINFGWFCVTLGLLAVMTLFV